MNHYATWTLYKKETVRFLKVYHQTIFGPIVSAVLIWAVFNLALGERVNMSYFDEISISFSQFIASGLIMMQIMQNAFVNTSSTIAMGRILGYIVYLIQSPLSAGQIMIAMIAASMTRSLLVSVILFIIIQFFVDIAIHDVSITILYFFLSSLLLSLIGIGAGLVADSFDKNAAFNNYIITPLSFLSGTFYSIHNLPDFWYQVSQYNPFFYIMDGFRHGITGYSDVPIETGIYVLVISNLFIGALIYFCLAKGFGLKK